LPRVGELFDRGASFGQGIGVLLQEFGRINLTTFTAPFFSGAIGSTRGSVTPFLSTLPIEFQGLS